MTVYKDLIFKTGVCRKCKAKWDLDRTYVQDESAEMVRSEAKCPECLSAQVSFPWERKKAAPKTEKLFRDEGEKPSMGSALDGASTEDV